jgi:hypothetical protein
VDIDNTSSSDQPDLIIEPISDTIQGDLTNAAQNYTTSDRGATIARDETCQITYSFVVEAAIPTNRQHTVETHLTGSPTASTTRPDRQPCLRGGSGQEATP